MWAPTVSSTTSGARCRAAVIVAEASPVRRAFKYASTARIRTTFMFNISSRVFFGSRKTAVFLPRVDRNSPWTSLNNQGLLRALCPREKTLFNNPAVCSPAGGVQGAGPLGRKAAAFRLPNLSPTLSGKPYIPVVGGGTEKILHVHDVGT